MLNLFKNKLRHSRICLTLQLLPQREPDVNLRSFNSVMIRFIHNYIHTEIYSLKSYDVNFIYK